MPFDLHFIRPFWLLALLPLALLLLTGWRRRAGASAWRHVVDPHLLPHLLVGEEDTPRRWPLILLGVGWSLLVLALAGPVWERLPQPVFSTSTERVILLDLSPSMNAADVPPSRLARARFEILDLLHAASEGQVALIAFGPEPFVVSPLTGDAKTIAAQVPQLSTDLIPVPGPRRTDLALKLAGEMLDRADAQGGDLILVTDAVGDMAGSLEVARGLQSAGRRLSVLAVGTAKGAPVPSVGGGFVKDNGGGIKLARLDSRALRELARAGQGRYLAAAVGEGDTKALIDAAPELGDRVEKTALVADQWREEGPWLLLILLPLAALAFRRGWLLSVMALILILPPSPGFALDWSDLWQRPDQRAARQFASGDAQGAARQFNDPAWRAAAHYRSGDYERALDALSDLEGPESDYNRGNALARQGRLEEAVDAYEQVLKELPDQADARQNLDLVRSLLEQQNDSEQREDQSEDSQDGQGREQHADESAGQGGDESRQGEAGAKDDQGEHGDQDEQAGAASESETDASAEQPASPSEDQDPDASSAGSTGRDAGPQRPPDARDFGQDALQSGPESRPPGLDEQAQDQTGDAGAAVTDRDDSGSDETAEQTGVGREPPLTPGQRERQQAMEAQLRRVPDDPAGLLRQRFLLQHLRREGRLP